MGNLFTWTSDPASGTWVNHAKSEEIRTAAIADTIAMKYVTPIDGYGKGKGESVDIQRFSKLTVPTTAQLEETLDIPIDKQSTARTRITIAEFGRGVEVTRKAIDLTYFKLTDIQEQQLREQMAQSLDLAAYTAFKTAKVKYIPTGAASGVFDTDGTASTQAQANVNLYHLSRIRDYARDTLNMPWWRDGMYVFHGSTKACRGIREDSNFVTWYAPERSAAGLNNVLGTIENMLIVENNNTSALAKDKGASGVMGEFLMHGADAVGRITALDPTLHYTAAGHAGRFKSVTWYGMLQFGEINPVANAGEARIIHGTSS